jgi:hypothetical protein
MTASALEASVTLDELCAVLGTKRVPMAPELAGYIALEVAEHADPMGGEIDPKSVYVGEEGTVALVQPKRDRPTGDAESSVRATLARLLEASGSQTPALAAASKRTGGGGLRALAAELEAALIPVNRAAGRRALARLAREARRAALGLGRHTLPSSSELGARAAAARSSPGAPDQAPESRPTPSPHPNVDALIARFSVSSSGEQGQSRELRAMAGIAETPPPPTIDRGSSAGQETRPFQHPEEVAPNEAEKAASASETLRSSMVKEPVPRVRAAPAFPTASPRRTVQRGLAYLAVACLGCAAAFVSSRMSHRTTPLPSGPAPAPTVPQLGAPAAGMPCRGLIVVSDVPRHAEVLFRLGPAPIDIDRMPVGARLEFVATADSYVPKRLVVPADAEWTTGADHVPRFSATVELERSHARPGTNDPWPLGEPGSEVGGQGPPGVVRVVVVPSGADVWMLSGLGPEARMEASCDRSTDVLVAGPTTFRRQLHVGPGDFAIDESGSGPPRTAPLRMARLSAR